MIMGFTWEGVGDPPPNGQWLGSYWDHDDALADADYDALYILDLTFDESYEGYWRWWEYGVLKGHLDRARKKGANYILKEWSDLKTSIDDSTTNWRYTVPYTVAPWWPLNGYPIFRIDWKYGNSWYAAEIWTGGGTSYCGD